MNRNSALTFAVETGGVPGGICHHDEAESNDTVHDSNNVGFSNEHGVATSVDKAGSTCTRLVIKSGNCGELWISKESSKVKSKNIINLETWV